MNPQTTPKHINLKGNLLDISNPLVMGILNITPDSFYQASRKQTEKEVIDRVWQLRNEGADIIDVGSYSSRPGADFVEEKVEMERLDFCLPILYREYPEAIVSIDTFRSRVIRKCADHYGVAIINDISGGEMNSEMFKTVADLQLPYILMHMQGTPQTMMQHTHYENLMQNLFLYFSSKINQLRQSGVNDIIIDPGFGFSKNTSQNFFLLEKLEEFHIFDLPLLVGISRKAMIRNVLNCSVEESLNGTTALHTIALMKGANILRVHDVKEAVECVRLLQKMKDSSHA